MEATVNDTTARFLKDILPVRQKHKVKLKIPKLVIMRITNKLNLTINFGGTFNAQIM